MICGDARRYADSENIVSQNLRFLLEKAEAEKIVADMEAKVRGTWYEVARREGLSEQDCHIIDLSKSVTRNALCAGAPGPRSQFGICGWRLVESLSVRMPHQDFRAVRGSFRARPGRGQSTAISRPMPESVMKAVRMSGPPQQILVQ
jgi:hypothetical protein